MLLLLLGCARTCAQPAPVPTVPAGFVTLPGVCEASAVIVREDGTWLVADNEVDDRLFAFDAGGRPIADVPLEERIDDLEAMTATPGGVLLVGSHSRNKKGEERPRRQRYGLLGKPATRADLRGCAACLEGQLRAPGAGGLDIEGAVWWGGRAWLGLRGPLVDGKAMLLGLGDDIYTTAPTTPPVLVDLGGDGVRDLAPWRDGLLVLSGPSDDRATPHALWWLASPTTPPQRLDVVLPPSSEGVAVLPDGRALVVTDGDGKPGAPCATPSTWGVVALPR